MSKSEIMTTDTGTASEPAAVTDKELDAVTGGSPLLVKVCATGAHVQSGHERWIEIQSISW
jgi:hypothetical protein